MMYYLGVYWNYTVGIMVLATLDKMILGAILRMWALYLRRGCGPWMLLALWNTTWHLFAMPVEIVKKAADALQAPIRHRGDGYEEQQQGDWQEDPPEEARWRRYWRRWRGGPVEEPSFREVPQSYADLQRRARDVDPHLVENGQQYGNLRNREMTEDREDSLERLMREMPVAPMPRRHAADSSDTSSS